MSLHVGEGNQVLTIHEYQDLTSEYLNKQLFQVFNPGVIDYSDIEMVGEKIRIGRISLLITPKNLIDTILKVDTTEIITLDVLSRDNTYIIASFNWLTTKDNYVEFNLTSVIDEYDIIIGKVDFENGEILYDEQTKPTTKLLTEYKKYGDVNMVDSRSPGNSDGDIPLSNGRLNENLNVESISGINIENVTVNSLIPQDNSVAQYLRGYSLQLQHGDSSRVSTESAVIPISNSILQVNLNAKYLNGYDWDYITNQHLRHVHYVNELIDDDYNKVALVNQDNQITKGSIKNGTISVSKMGHWGNDISTGLTYTPVFESGTVTLIGTTPAVILFDRRMSNPRIFIQRVHSATTINNNDMMSSERSAFPYNIFDTTFTISQTCSSSWRGMDSDETLNDLTLQPNDDTTPVTYMWVAIGQAI